jgi:hypothetical protein
MVGWPWNGRFRAHDMRALMTGFHRPNGSFFQNQT